MSIDVPPLERAQSAKGPERRTDVIVVGIVGHAGAGKTALAAALSAYFDSYSVVSFGDAIKRRADQRDRRGRSDRRLMVDEGARWVAEDPEGLVRDVLKTRSSDTEILVVEGVHHINILRVLKDVVSPAPTAVVHLKATEQQVLQVAVAEDRSLLPIDVLEHSTEQDVDRELLAAADLVLDGSVDTHSNAKTVAAFLQRMHSAERETPAFVGGLDAGQRELVVVAIAEDFGWRLPIEVAQTLNLSVAEVRTMISERRIFAVEINGTDLCPAFVLSERRLNEAVSRASQALSDVLTDWELALWLVAANGILDGLRPVDVDVDDLNLAIQAELDN